MIFQATFGSKNFETIKKENSQGMVACLNLSLAQIFLKRHWVIYETWSDNFFHFPSRIKHINVKRKEYNFNFLIGIWHLLFSVVYFIFYNY